MAHPPHPPQLLLSHLAHAHRRAPADIARGGPCTSLGSARGVEVRSELRGGPAFWEVLGRWGYISFRDKAKLNRVDWHTPDAACVLYNPAEAAFCAAVLFALMSGGTGRARSALPLPPVYSPLLAPVDTESEGEGSAASADLRRAGLREKTLVAVMAIALGGQGCSDFHGRTRA
ncbi:hypothetical protein K438DRAFT_1938405 [Mycena galopus ATCC 62051]|nr:hypothetical protein K438DRAFT_1938405 [Mycena galopus ATCC 62051]